MKIRCFVLCICVAVLCFSGCNINHESLEQREPIYHLNPDEVVEGTVKELAEKYGLSILEMTGFLDGINDSLVTPNPIEEMEEDTKVSLGFDKVKLYKNMVDAKAEWLYELPMWDEIFDAETKKALYLEQKKSGTVVVGKKVGRNEPCPCGSGKKYKHCCGK